MNNKEFVELDAKKTPVEKIKRIVENFKEDSNLDNGIAILMSALHNLVIINYLRVAATNKAKGIHHITGNEMRHIHIKTLKEMEKNSNKSSYLAK